MRRSVLLATSLLALAPFSAVDLAAQEPLATAMTNWEGIEVDLLQMERRRNVLTLKWAARNSGEQQVEVRFSLTGRSVTTYLVDEESGTKYYALTDKEKTVLASEHEWVASDTFGISDKVPAGGLKRYWAKFPAPPPEVTEISVFLSGSEPLEGVSIVDK